MSIVIIIVITLVLIGVFAALYNSLVSKRNKVHEASSGIDIMLKKRYDLIPNLVEIVKGYMHHEKGTLESVVSLRNRAMKTDNNSDKIKLDSDISKGMFQIFALAESYPELKASTNFLEVQSELSEVETDIERSKRYYNATVRELNTAVQSFPGNIVAGSFGFEEEDFYELSDKSYRDAVKIEI